MIYGLFWGTSDDLQFLEKYLGKCAGIIFRQILLLKWTYSCLLTHTQYSISQHSQHVWTLCEMAGSVSTVCCSSPFSSTRFDVQYPVILLFVVII